MVAGPYSLLPTIRGTTGKFFRLSNTPQEICPNASDSDGMNGSRAPHYSTRAWQAEEARISTSRPASQEHKQPAISSEENRISYNGD